MNEGQHKVTIVVANPKTQSRTRAIAEMLVKKLIGQSGSDPDVIELAEHQQDLFAWPSAKMDDLIERVAHSDLVVFATPTYKASYTGLMKCFLDRYQANGLQGTLAIGLMTGGGEAHSLAPNTTLVPLLLELGASVLGRGIYFNIQHFDQAEAKLAEVSAELTDTVRRSARLLSAIENQGGQTAA